MRISYARMHTCITLGSEYRLDICGQTKRGYEPSPLFQAIEQTKVRVLYKTSKCYTLSAQWFYNPTKVLLQ